MALQLTHNGHPATINDKALSLLMIPYSHSFVMPIQATIRRGDGEAALYQASLRRLNFCLNGSIMPATFDLVKCPGIKTPLSGKYPFELHQAPGKPYGGSGDPLE